MWPESSPVNAVNLVKKICYNSRDIEFFLGDYFLAHPVKCKPLVKLEEKIKHKMIAHLKISTVSAVLM